MSLINAMNDEKHNKKSNRNYNKVHSVFLLLLFYSHRYNQVNDRSGEKKQKTKQNKLEMTK